MDFVPSQKLLRSPTRALSMQLADSDGTFQSLFVIKKVQVDVYSVFTDKRPI